MQIDAVDPAHNSHMYYVYLIYSRKSGKFYIGYTSDLRKRIAKHNTGMSMATKPYVPYDLIYYEAYRSENDAIERERHLKCYGQSLRRLKERIKESVKNASCVRG